MKKLILKLLRYEAAKGETIEWNYVCFKTVVPDEILPYNLWQIYINRQLN